MNTSRIVSSFNDKPKATASMFDSKIVMAAIRNSFLKLDPRVQIRNPVMFWAVKEMPEAPCERALTRCGPRIRRARACAAD